MALDENALSALIVSNFPESGTPNVIQEFADAIAKAVVDHIKSSAQVQVTGVQPGPGTAVGTIE